MSDITPSQDTSPDLMQAFIEKHGSEALDEKTSDSGSPTPESASPAAEPDLSPPKEDDGIEETPGLDEATLQALGLAEEGTPSPVSDNEEGTEQSSQIDLPALAKTLGLSEDDLSVNADGVRLKTKVDGESGEVSLAELRKGYQLQSHFTRQQESFLAERQQWEQARQQQEQQIQQQSAFANEVLAAEEQQIQQQYTRNWDQLRQDDPAEYAAQVAEYNQKLSGVKQRRQDLNQNFHNRQQEQAQQAQQQDRQYLQQAARHVAETLKWDNEKAWSQGVGEVSNYLVAKEGYRQEEIAQIRDPRILIMADKARRFEELQAKIASARKKVKESHKMPAGSAPKPGKSGKRRNLEAARERLAKDHSVEAAANVFKHMGVA